METSEMTPRARWARAVVEPHLAERPDGMQTPVTLTCQHLDDLGLLLDPVRAAEIAAEAMAGALARITELEGELAALRAQNTLLLRQTERAAWLRRPRPAEPLDAKLAAAAQKVVDLPLPEVTG